jgi:dUTPase
MLGTIDNPYRGEIGVSIHNNNAMPDTPPIFMPYSLKGERIVCDEADSTLRAYCGAYLIRKGERFAQIVFNEVVRPLEIVEGKVSDDTDRGNRGFGSSGV